MEVAGFGIGIVGLLSLYSTCQELLAAFSSYHHYESESRHITARFNSDIQRLDDWVRDNLKDDNHARILEKDVARASAVYEVLACVRDLFRSIDRKRPRLQHPQKNERFASATHMLKLLENGPVGSTNQRSLVPRMNRVQWSLKGRVDFASDVDSFGVLVDKLHQLFSPEGPHKPLGQHISGKLDEIQRLTGNQRLARSMLT